MRRFGFLTAAPLAIALVACGSDNQGGDDVAVDAATNPPGSTFRITTPDITIHAGEEVTYCYYTTIPTTETLGVKRWSSTMTPGSHHLILFFGDSGKADGTIAVLEVAAGQAVIARRGEWVRYSTPGAEGAEYLAICLPAFSPDTVHRDP